MKNIFTLDVEDWYHTLDFNIPVKEWPGFEDRIKWGLYKLLDILTSYGVKATFFILGWIARNHPEIVKDIFSSGHEIGSHGMYHRMVNTQTREEFREDAALSKSILQEITGRKVIMYRASSWSINESMPWALEILEEEGYEYDSSMQPFKTPLSGSGGIPLHPFRPVVNGRAMNIIEVPSSVIRICRINMPFSGGFYFRALPGFVISRALSFINRDRPGMLYLHPWEFDAGQPRIKAPLHRKFIHYHNIRSNMNKLEYILKRHRFHTLSEVLRDCESKTYSLSQEVY